MYTSFQKYKDSTPKPDVQKFSKVQGFNTKAWCTEVFKSIWIQHQSLMYRSFQKYMDSTPKPDVQKFSKVQGFHNKAWCTEVLKSTRSQHQSLMYASSQKYKVSTPKPDVYLWVVNVMFLWDLHVFVLVTWNVWCTFEICVALYLWLEMYDEVLRFACLCTCDLKCMMYFWDLHVFVLVTWNVWCTFEMCMSSYLWLEAYDVLVIFACLCTYGLGWVIHIEICIYIWLYVICSTPVFKFAIDQICYLWRWLQVHRSSEVHFGTPKVHIQAHRYTHPSQKYTVLWGLPMWASKTRWTIKIHDL